MIIYVAARAFGENEQLVAYQIDPVDVEHRIGRKISPDALCLAEGFPDSNSHGRYAADWAGMAREDPYIDAVIAHDDTLRWRVDCVEIRGNCPRPGRAGTCERIGYCSQWLVRHAV